MSDESFPESLNEMYQGEIIGEVLFDQMLRWYSDPEQQYKVAVMLQLETETKARLRPAMMALGVDIAEPEASRKLGLEMADGLAGKSWDEVVVMLGETVKPYVERYREIAAAAPAEYRELANSMVTHEQSLYDFAQLEQSGAGMDSVAAIVAQLEHKPPAP